MVYVDFVFYGKIDVNSINGQHETLGEYDKKTKKIKINLSSYFLNELYKLHEELCVLFLTAVITHETLHYVFHKNKLPRKNVEKIIGKISGEKNFIP